MGLIIAPPKALLAPEHMKISLRVWLKVYPRHYWGSCVSALQRVGTVLINKIPRVYFWRHKTEIFGKPQTGFHFTVTRR